MRTIRNAVKKFARPYTLIKEDESEGEFIDGIYIPGDDDTAEIQLVLQPLSDKEIQSLPEGQRTLEPLKFFTLETITGKEKFVRDGKLYTVESFSTWDSHTEGRAVRTGELQ